MRFKIQGLEVCFPYASVYKEQLEYMTELKRILDNHGHGILEMPTGTGKTVSLLALITSYLESNPDKFKKLIYCTRTVVEMEKTIEEVKFVLENRKKEKPAGQFKFLCTGLSARSNLCIHPKVSKQQLKDKVDAECKRLTAPWIRAMNFDAEQDSSKDYKERAELCDWFEEFERKKEEMDFTEGVYNLEDLRDYGREHGVCPYFTARRLLARSNIIIYNYLYILDANIIEVLDKDLWKDCLVVFDEAHNIDNICLEVFTVDINRKLLDIAHKNIDALGMKVERVETFNHNKLEMEYNKLIEGLKTKGVITEKQSADSSKTLPTELTTEAIPFHIRKAKPFMNFLKNIVIFLKNRLKEKNALNQDPPQFLNDMYISNHLDQVSLKMASERLNQLLNSLEITETDEFAAINKITRFTSLLATHTRGFKVIHQPNPKDGSLNDPVLSFTCLDCSLAMVHVFESFKSVILTSGTMSPLDIYPKILNFTPYVIKSIDIELTRNSIQPLIATKGQDFSELSSEFEARQNMTVTRSYGSLLIDLSRFVPDGIVVFFPSYMYMEKMIFEWNEEGILDEMRKYKLLYFESKDVAQTSQSLAHFRRACDCGRGALFFSIARGKVAEGIDFNEHYGRCVVMVGFPVQNSKDPILIERCNYLTENFKVTKSEYIEFDAMRQTAQCLGRVMRGKTDYGIMIMAEKRYGRNLIKQKLPNWIKKQMPDCNVNISVDVVTVLTEQFFKKMGKPFELDTKSYFTQEYFDELENNNKANDEMEIESTDKVQKSSNNPNNQQLNPIEQDNDRRESELLEQISKMRQNRLIIDAQVQGSEQPLQVENQKDQSTQKQEDQGQNKKNLLQPSKLQKRNPKANNPKQAKPQRNKKTK